MDLEADTPKKKKMALWKKIAIGSVLFIGGCVSFILLATSGAVEAVESQLAALRAGDVDKAYSLTSKAFRQATSREQFAQFTSRYKVLSKNKEYSFTSRSVSGGVGKLEGTLTAQDGTVRPVRYQLVKEEGEWRVLHITFQTEAK